MKKEIKKPSLVIKEEIKISSFVKSMTSNAKFPDNLNYRAEYRKHLEEKYK
jgi:hypothetical protein